MKNVRGKSVNNSVGRVKIENGQILTDEREIKVDGSHTLRVC